MNSEVYLGYFDLNERNGYKMERILYFDCLAGISGDMTLGALLDLGIDKERFYKELEKLNVDGFEVIVEKKVKEGISGTDVHVHLNNHTHGGHQEEHLHVNHTHGDHQEEHHHENHTHKNEVHNDEQNHSHHHHSHDHIHRNLYDIQKIIDDSDISNRTKLLSKEIFMEVAKAEASVHGKNIEEIHFHEVGALDSIVDIIGTAICIDLLDVDHIYSSPLHLGTGFVNCAHGLIPIPAPATMEILQSVPIYSKGIESELVTPTGAAIIKTLAKDFVPMTEMEIEKIGYGMGDRQLPIKNMLRVVLGKKKPITRL